MQKLISKTRASKKTIKAESAPIESAPIAETIESQAIAPIAATESETIATESEALAPIAETIATEAPKRIHESVNPKYYSGLSSYLNSERKTAIGLGVQKYGKRDLSKLTDRMRGQLTATKLAYNTSEFRARGFDNAICAILINSGLYSYTGGIVSNGILSDLPDSPVMLSHTESALAFGKAK
jgi:hypothetical protein